MRLVKYSGMTEVTILYETEQATHRRPVRAPQEEMVELAGGDIDVILPRG
jgi:hypothetical protein